MAIQGVAIDKQKLIRAIHRNKGIINRAAKELDCCSHTIFHRAKDDEDISTAIKEAREKAQQEYEDKDHAIVSDAYDSLSDLIAKRDVTATIFALKTKAKFDDKVSVAPITVQVIQQPFKNESA